MQWTEESLEMFRLAQHDSLSTFARSLMINMPNHALEWTAASCLDGSEMVVYHR